MAKIATGKQIIIKTYLYKSIKRKKKKNVMRATTKLSCIVILFATLFSTACKKETAEKPGSKPLETFISSNTEFDVYEIDDFPRTMTIIFKTTKAGKITHI